MLLKPNMVFPGNGDGTFAPAITYPAPVNYRNVDLGDVDGDGDLDLLAGGEEPPATFEQFLDRPAGARCPRHVATPFV